MPLWQRSAIKEEVIVDRVRLRRISNTECEVIFLPTESPVGGINITNTLSFFMDRVADGFRFSPGIGSVDYSFLPDRATSVMFILVHWRGGHLVTDGTIDYERMFISVSLYCHSMELYNRLKWLEVIEVPIIGFDRTDSLAPWSIILDTERITIISE